MRETQTTEEEPCTFVRWVKGAEGRFVPRVFPLTPEAFLDPRIGDTMVQGNPHANAATELFELLKRHFRHRPDVLVLHDLKHLLGRRIGPAPDVSVVLGAEEIDRSLSSYGLAKIGFPPSLIIEVVSPTDARIRRVDEVDKVQIYAEAGVKEHFLQDLPRRANGWKVRLWGYRLDDRQRYRPIESDAQGRLASETTGLLFGVSPAGDRMEVFVASTGKRLLSPVEVEEEHRREAEARKAAEAEIDRLRRELERLRGGE